MSQQPIGSNLGGGLIKQARILLTNDAILTLPTTVITIIEAPGANKIITMIGGNVLFTVVDAYTNVNAAVTTRYHIGLSQPSDVMSGNTYYTTPDNYLFTDRYISLNGESLSDVVNQPLTLAVVNDVDGDFEDGGSDNYLLITIPYMIYNTLTGLFE